MFFAIRQEPSTRSRPWLIGASFLVPLLLWSLVSYCPLIWHPMVAITSSGDIAWMQEGALVEKEVFLAENERMRAAELVEASGTAANPVYLPAPHQVAMALVKSFTTPPLREGDPWLHQSLWHSIRTVVWGFLLSSLLGVPLGVLSGAFPRLRLLSEPFIEFFRYLPAPAFGALAVAILGISDAPKIAIIFIGTFFQQVLIVGNSTRRFDHSLIEAAQTLGAGRMRTLFKVIVPGILPDIYKDQRILLGWAWTYLIVAEVVGESTGITWFINQQAKYRQFDNVYAAILIIGLVGLATDMLLALIGRNLFPWTGSQRHAPVQRVVQWWNHLPVRAPNVYNQLH